MSLFDAEPSGLEGRVGLARAGIENAGDPFSREEVRPEPGIHSPLLAAAGLGLLGWGAGVLAGLSIKGDCTSEFCALEGIIYGGAAGGGLGLAIGAHIGNRGRGSLLLDIATSAAVWGFGFVALQGFVASGSETGVYATAIALPPVQLLATVLAERAMGRTNAAKAEGR